MGKYVLIIRTNDDAFGFILALPSDVVSVSTDYFYRPVSPGDIIETPFENIEFLGKIELFTQNGT